MDLAELVTKEDESQLRLGSRYLKSALRSVFGGSPIDIIAYVLGDQDELVGLFKSDRDFYQFEISAEDEVKYYRLSFKQPQEYRGDGLQIKKNCRNSTPCGEACIPKGAICRQGIPTAGSVKTRAVRALLKGSRKLARAAVVVAGMAAAGAIATYAMKKIDTEKLKERAGRAIDSVGLDRKNKERIQQFISDVAVKAGAKNVGAAIAPQPEISRLRWMKYKYIDAPVQEYMRAWRAAPAKTALQHLSVGMLLVGVEQLGEQAGYIPEGTLMNAINKDKVQTRMKQQTRPKRQRYKVNSRNTPYGA